MPSRRTPATSVAEHHAAGATVLLIIDMISHWRFKDADKLLPQAERIAEPIAALRARCRKAGVPVIYANDNHGMWRSDFRQVVDAALARGGAGARITERLRPDGDDYFVLKPKHSAFFATPLELLLQHLQAHRLLLTGAASDQCIVATAMDARMRDYDVIVPADCVASQTPQRNERALRHLADVMKLRTPASTALRLGR